ncbi:MAG: type II toxin-antitoxin system VapC family toxin [Candidatus Limnocylindria bacterium]
MRLLLDTATFLWYILDSPRLSAGVREALTSPANEPLMSSVSAWEIAVKHHLGRLALPEDPRQLIPRARTDHGIGSLAFDEESALQLGVLPDLHGDPFDRMLICQALIGGIAIVTPDEMIRRYPVRTFW